MTAPDADSKPNGGGAVPPEALATGQRTLAAIVFTDTVGFSALMARDEELTLRLVARDMVYMKTTCEAFGGHVLKSTGDGFLMLFTSAVQAVACSLEMQRDLQKKNLELPASERLQHRIGIHLGDVFQQGGDVMGDGVNIAARLQTEAVPGGICMSKTVYDVVHNRLPFYVNELGARRLKNIGKVMAYQISPTETQGWFGPVWYHWWPWVRGVASILALALALFLIFRLGMYHQHYFTGANSSSASARQPAPAPTPNPEPVPPVASAEPAKAPPGGLIEVSDQEFEMVRFDRMRNYDFEGMMDWLALHDWPEKSSSKLGRQCHDMQHLFRWTQEQLHGYSESSPLVITDAGGKKTAFWTVAFGGLKMKTGSQTITVVREQIPPVVMQQIVLELLAKESLPAAERTHFQGDLAVFTDVYHLPPPEKTSTNP